MLLITPDSVFELAQTLCVIGISKRVAVEKFVSNVSGQHEKITQ